MREPLTDGELTARCRLGDEQAWSELVDRFSRYVYAIAIQAFRLPQHEAEDVFQDVFARAHARLGQLRSDDAIRPWLAQLTRNACLDCLRAGSRTAPSGELDPEEPVEALDGLEEAWAVRQALEALSGPCREILDLFSRDESYRAIGESLGIPPGTVASRISRCLGSLRAQLEGRIEAPAPSSAQVTG